MMFQGYAERFGWSFDEIEKNLGVKLNLANWEIQQISRGIARGESRYHRKLKKQNKKPPLGQGSRRRR